MAFKVNSTDVKQYTDRGVPYMWNSYDGTTGVSNETILDNPYSQGSSDYFGYSVAIGHGLIAVGAPYAEVPDNAPGDPPDIRAGAVFIYDIEGNFIRRIYASDAAAFDRYGWSVKIGAGKIIVCARDEDDEGSDAGKVYIYDLDGSNEDQYTGVGINTGDEFGHALDVSDGYIVATEIGTDDLHTKWIASVDSDNSYALGTEFQQANNISGYSSYRCVAHNNRILLRDNSNNTVGIYDMRGKRLGYLDKVSSTISFGHGLATGCGIMVAGDPLDDSNGLTNSGAIYIYDMFGKNEKKIELPNPQDYSDAVDGEIRFGANIQVSNGRIAVGGRQDLEGNPGIIWLLDLEGNLVDVVKAGTVSRTDNRFGSTGFYGTTDRGNPNFDVGPGKLAVGAHYYEYDAGNGAYYGRVFLYDMPTIYTIYDALDLQRGDK